MSIWSHRPPLLHLGFFIAAYVLGCAFAKALAIVPGSTVSFWPPGGLFIATLILTPVRSWPWWVLAGCLAEMFGQLVWFDSPLPGGLLIYAGNALEAAVGAWLVNRACGRPVRLETVHEVLAFVVLGAGVAPLISATVGAASLAWFGVKSQTFAAAWPLWWIGDATGILIVAPLTLVVVENWRGRAQLSAVPWMEVSAVVLVFLSVAALALGGYLPFAYIVMPPLLWAAVRFDFKGAAVILILLALITAVFTISGASQFAGDPESQRQRQIMLHLFLAVSAFSALIVAAISREHQHALLTLRERERQLQQLIDAVPAAIVRRSSDGEPTFFNKRMVDFLGLDVADTEKPDMSRMSVVIQTLVHPDDATRVRESLKRSFTAGQGYSNRYRLRRADAVYRWMETRGEPLRDQGGAIAQWYSVSIDIEDEVRAQDALRRSEWRLRQLIDALPAMIWSTTPAGTPTYANKRFTDVIGATVDDITAPDGSPSLSAIIHPEDIGATMAAVRRSMGTGNPYVMQYRQLRRGGSYRWTETRAEPLRDESGEILQWYGVSVDIHDMLTAQDALRRSERELSQLVNMVPVHIRRLTPEGEAIFWNKRMMDFLGLELAELREQSEAAAIQTFIHPDDTASLFETVRRCLAAGEAWAVKYRLRRADGVYRWVEGRAEPMWNQDGTIEQWYAVSIDIDDYMRAQQAEEALRQASVKLAQATQVASLAELSASIAHEVNQPLAAIVANSHACERWLSAEPPNVERAKITVGRITRDANAAADVVGRIRALFKQSAKPRNSTPISGAIAEACSLMAEEAARRRVRMEKDIESDLPLVAFDRVQVQQVLINLIRNGMDAMESAPGERLLRVRVRRLGDAVRTEISDRGQGVKFPDKIFEPFFTTSENGMGMGLAICRSIVESHGGRLWLEGNERGGATFIFTLPIDTPDAP